MVRSGPQWRNINLNFEGRSVLNEKQKGTKRLKKSDVRRRAKKMIRGRARQEGKMKAE